MVTKDMQIYAKSEATEGFKFFYLRAPRQALPAISYNKDLLLNSRAPQVLNYSSDEVPLAELIFEIYPELSLLELALLMADLKHLGYDCFAEILAKYNLAHHENLILVLQALLSQPASFKTWVHERKLAARDLAALRLPLGRDFFPILEKICELQCSRQVGIQILELAAEIFLMGQPPANILAGASTAEKWLSALKTQRYPRTSEADTQMQKKIKELPWPSHVDAEWQRRGDQTGLHIKFFAQSESELNRRIDGIKNLKNIWTN